MRALGCGVAFAGAVSASRARAEEPAPSPRATPILDEPKGAPTPLPSDEDELALLFSAPAKSAVGSKSETAVAPEDIAADVTVIGGDEIRAMGCRTLGDVLALMPATFVSTDRINDTAGIRGFAQAGDPNNRVLLLIDGHVIDDAYQHFSPIDAAFPLDFTAVERVELIAGPASSIYGSNAFFGVVNVVTRRPPGAELAASGGSFGYVRGEGAWGAASPAGAETPWTVAVSATGRNVEGEDIAYDPATNKNWAAESGTDHSRDASAWMRATAGRVTVALSVFGRERGLLDTTAPARFGDPANVIGVQHSLADVTVAILRGDTVRLRARGYGDAVRIWDNNHDVPPTPDFFYRSATQQGGVELVGEWNAGPGNVVATAEESWEKATAIESPTVWRAVTLGTVTGKLRLASLGHLELGGYGETSALSGARVAPRAALVLHPWWGSTVKLVGARGFRDPSLFALSETAQLRTLHAETLDDAEAWAGQKLDVRGVRVELFGNAFAYRIDGLLARLTDYSFQNSSDTVSAEGGTVGTVLRGTRGTLRADASLFAERLKSGPGGVRGSPGSLAHVVATGKISPRVTGGVAIKFVGSRIGRSGKSDLPQYSFVDASIDVARVVGIFDLKVSGENLLDVKTVQPTSDDFVSPTMPGRRRSLLAEVRAMF